MSERDGKRALPSPVEEIVRTVDGLKEDCLNKNKSRKVHFLLPTSSSSPKKDIASSSKTTVSNPTFSNDGVELVTGFESKEFPINQISRSNSEPVVTSETSTKSKKLKVILHEHSFEKPYNLDLINSLVKNFKFLSCKEAHTKPSTLICEIDLSDLDNVIDKNNWSDKIKNLSLDKKSHLLDSYCVNKLVKDKESEPIISLEVIYKHLEENGINRVLNFRREGNLVVFEVVKGDISDEFSFSVKHNNIISKHYCRIYDPLDNYIIQCKKCFKFGHTFSSCSSKKQLCSWCGKENCARKCSIKCCVNCGKGHSAFYRGCEIYKKLSDKASISRNDRQKIRKINTISESVSQVKNTCDNFQKSYAHVVNFEKKSSTLEEKVDKCLAFSEKIQSCLSAINTNLTSIKENYSKVNNKLSSLEKSISSLFPRIDSLESQTSSLSSSINNIKETYVTKTELSEELSSELKSISQSFVNKELLLLTMFECLYAIDKGQMSGFMEICYHLLAISSRHLGPIDKTSFISKFTELQQTSLIASQEIPDKTISLP